MHSNITPGCIKLALTAKYYHLEIFQLSLKILPEGNVTL